VEVSRILAAARQTNASRQRQEATNHWTGSLTALLKLAFGALAVS
jgi:hypothetical protein